MQLDKQTLQLFADEAGLSLEDYALQNDISLPEEKEEKEEKDNSWGAQMFNAIPGGGPKDFLRPTLFDQENKKKEKEISEKERKALPGYSFDKDVFEKDLIKGFGDPEILKKILQGDETLQNKIIGKGGQPVRNPEKGLKDYIHEKVKGFGWFNNGERNIDPATNKPYYPNLTNSDIDTAIDSIFDIQATQEKTNTVNSRIKSGIGGDDDSRKADANTYQGIDLQVAKLVEQINHGGLSEEEKSNKYKEVKNLKDSQTGFTDKSSKNMLFNYDTGKIIIPRSEEEHMKLLFDENIKPLDTSGEEYKGLTLDELGLEYKRSSLAMGGLNKELDEVRFGFVDNLFGDERGESQKRIPISFTLRDFIEKGKRYTDSKSGNVYAARNVEMKGGGDIDQLIERLKDDKIEYTADHEALKRMYLLNDGLLNIDKSGAETALKSFIEPFIGRYGTDLLMGGQSERVILDKVGEKYGDLGIEVTKEQEKELERDLGETINEGFFGSGKILAEFYAVGKILKPIEAASGLAKYMQYLNSSRYTKGAKSFSEASVKARAAASNMPVGKIGLSGSYANLHKLTLEAPSIAMKAKGIAISGLMEGAKFEAISRFDTGGEEGGFATGFGFGAAGRIIAPLAPYLARKGYLKDIDKGVVNLKGQALFQQFVAAPASFVAGSEAGEIVNGIVNDALGNKQFSDFMEEHYGDFGEVGKRLIANGFIGVGFGMAGPHGSIFKGFADFKSEVGLIKTRDKAFSKIQKSLNQNASIPMNELTEGLTPKVMEKAFFGANKFNTIQKARFNKNYEVYKNMSGRIFQLRQAKGYLNPETARDYVEKDMKPIIEANNKLGIVTKVEVVNNNNLQPGQKRMNVDADVISKDNGKTKTYRFNAERYTPDVMAHEVSHDYFETQFEKDAIFKGEFMSSLNNIASKIKLERIITEKEAKDLGNPTRIGDKMNLSEAIKLEKFDLSSSINNQRITQWELFSHIAQQIGTKSNYLKLKESDGFSELGKLIKNFGKKGNQKYNLTLEKDVVRWFRDYSKNVKKGVDVRPLFAELESVVDYGATMQQRINMRGEAKSRLSSRNLEAEKADLLAENKELLEKKPEGYREKNKEISDKVKALNKNIEASNINAENIRIYKQREAEGKDPSLQLKALRENNQGILNDFVNQNYKEVPGSNLTKSEFKNYVDNIEFLKIINSYKAESGVPFGAYLRQNIRPRMGNILKALGVDMDAKMQTVSRDAEGFTEKEFAETGISTEVAGESKGIKLIYELPVKQETIDLITKKVDKLEVEKLDYKNLKDLALSETKKMFGKTTKDKAKFIADNAKVIYDLLPKGSSKITGTATGVENSILKDFYTKGSRVKTLETGSKAGLSVQEKIQMTRSEFLNKLGIKQKLDGTVDVSGMNRNIKTSTIPAIINQTGKAITNQIVRSVVKQKGIKNVANILNKIGSGKSDALQSKNLEKQSFKDQVLFLTEAQTKGFKSLLERNLSLLDPEKAVQKTLVDHFADYKSKGNEFSISKNDLKSIGSEIQKSFKFQTITPKLIAGKAGKAIELPNSLEAIDLKAGLKPTKYTLNTVENIVEGRAVARVVAKELIKKYGDGVYEVMLLRGESGGKGIGKGDSLADLGVGKLNSKNRNSLFEAAEIAKDYFSDLKSELEAEGFTVPDYKGKKTDGSYNLSSSESDMQGNKAGQINRLVDKSRKKWNESELNKAFVAGEFNKTVLKDAVKALRNAYKTKEITHEQARAWVEIHAANMTGLIKKSASFAIVPNMTPEAMFKMYPEKVIKDKETGILTSNYVLEHTTPAQYVKARIYDFIINGGEAKKTALDLTLRDYHTTLIPEKFDAMVNKTLKTELPSWHLPGMDPIASRYYEANHSSNFSFGLKAFAGHRKKAVYDHHPNLSHVQKINQGKQLRKINAKLFPEGLAKATSNRSNSKNLESLRNIDKALDLGRKKYKKSRGMSTFDFDETVGVSENYVFANKGGKKKKISSAEWPFVGDKLLKEGWKMDFTDFNRVTKGRPGPLMQKMKNQIKKFGPENVFILTARAPESQKAIHDYLKSEGIEIPLKNVTGLGNSTGEAKALWMLEKFAEGYNDMYFVDDAMPNVKAVKNVLNQLDIKSKVQQALQAKDLSGDFNGILQNKTGTEAFKKFSLAKAQQLGSKKNKYKFFGTPGSEDFSGLVTYAFAGKGKKGEAHKKFFEDNLHNPYNRAWMNIHKRKQALSTDYKTLRKQFPNITKRLNNKVDGVYTIDQAVRVHLHDKAGYELPGLSKTDFKKLTDYVRKDSELLAYAENLSKISKLKEGWTKPKDYWLAENITSDLNNTIDRVYRKEAMAEFIENREAIFGKWENGKLVGENMNKIEALYGSKHRDALDNMIWRMENFTNRAHGTDANTARWMNWVNNASSTIMFFNQKSAMLQTISNVNYVNGKENNPFAAAKAFANQPQYWKDFMRVMNSDMLVQRRAGLKINVEAAEIVERISGGKNAAGRALSVLLEKGFIPTKYADSFAISLGGATYYRNRIKMYEKQGLKTKQAETKAWEDFSMLTEKTQQSSRPDLVSAQQSSALGRPILSFANTPMQMFRRHKRRLQDIANRRGSIVENVLSSVYYGFVQTMLFSYLSNAMFAIDEDAKDEESMEFADKKKSRYSNTIADSYLRGMGTGGAAVSAIKNSLLTVAKESEKSNPKYHKSVVELLNVSPPIGSKVRKLISAGNTYTYNKRAIGKSPLLGLRNPAVHANSQIISAFTNAPADRIVEKLININDASNSDFENWQRIAMFLGINKWSLGLKDEYTDKLNKKGGSFKSFKKFKSKKFK